MKKGMKRITKILTIHGETVGLEWDCFSGLYRYRIKVDRIRR